MDVLPSIASDGNESRIPHCHRIWHLNPAHNQGCTAARTEEANVSPLKGTLLQLPDALTLPHLHCHQTVKLLTVRKLKQKLDFVRHRERTLVDDAQGGCARCFLARS
eukprot:TRINITY_DN11103_c0_g2_i1.p1 TRINITY_DN11103_c0_g2~~TRINITY_DN11103_c0_g2_i1.p1  ORF type:complete len:107 (+),score=15.87 TRINITY_DN11103_c0_g2_i1:252-572(+)